MGRPSKNPSVFDEPHLRGGSFQIDPSEARAKIPPEGVARVPSLDQRLEQSVHDEPSYSVELAGKVPEHALAYDRWLEDGRARTEPATTWMVTLVVSLLASPWGIVGALVGAQFSFFPIFSLVVFGPFVEELMKTAAALWVVERRPYWFQSPTQILVAALAGGAGFGAIENWFYLHDSVPDPGAALIEWRWTVCVALHSVCSLIVGMGLARIWMETWERRRRPRLEGSYPFLVAGVVLHGSYNGLMLALSMAGWTF